MIHYYKHLDKSDPLTVNLPLHDLAKQLVDMNYGVQRFLSHLLDARREAHTKRVAEVRKRSPEAADYIERTGDELANGIEALLKKGLF